MTRPEWSGTRDLTFSQWIRTNLPDSSTGFLVTDLDFILFNYKTKKIMLVEVKTHGAFMKLWQSQMFTRLSEWIEAGIKDWQFLGFHSIRFENTSFEDGKCWLNQKEVDPFQLKEFLSML